MCQYVSKCPVAVHPHGAICQLEERRKSRDRRVLFGLVVLIVAVAVDGRWWVILPGLQAVSWQYSQSRFWKLVSGYGRA